MISVNKTEMVLNLVNSKVLSNGTVLHKMQTYSPQGWMGIVCENNIPRAAIASRFNFRTSDWLSMQPYTQNRYDVDGKEFGEVNAENNLHGKVIFLPENGDIHIGFC